MQPDQQAMKPVNPEASLVNGEDNTAPRPEALPSAETFADTAPAAPAAVPVADPIPAPVAQADDSLPPAIAPQEEITDDTAILAGDSKYFDAINKVIRDDADKPYVEEQESELLQKNYLKDRFGVRIDMDKEESK